MEKSINKLISKIMAKNKITILLIKEGTPKEEYVKSEHVQSIAIGEYTFYYKMSRVNEPKWVQSFFNGLNCSSNLKSSSVQAVLIVPVHVDDNITRSFAVCFGFGRNLLNLDKIEERFGLITTLNLIESDKLRCLDYRNIDSVPMSSKVQSSKVGGINNFNIDIEKDFLKSASGKINEKTLGSTITGSDSLSISSDVTIDNIEDVLKECYNKYKSENYKKTFSWINNLTPIKNKDFIHVLDQKMINEINNRNYDKVWMSIPELLDWEKNYEFKLSKNGETKDDIYIQDVIKDVIETRI